MLSRFYSWLGSHADDGDGDGVKDPYDQCWIGDDLLDLDQDGTPDACDTFVDSDADGVIDNFGGNITRSYANPYGGDFGHKLLQGELHQTAFHSLTVSRALTEQSRWEVYAQHILRKEAAIGNSATENWIMVGIQTRGMLQPVQDY